MDGVMISQGACSPDDTVATVRSTLEARLTGLNRQRFALRSEIEGLGPATADRAALLARKGRGLRAINRQIALTEVDLLSLHSG